MPHSVLIPALLLFTMTALSTSARAQSSTDAVVPKETLRLFNGKDLSGLKPYLKESGANDPKQVFRVTDGLLHITGDGMGGIATDKAYRNYRLVAEYKWGTRTDGGKYVRNSGLLLHAHGPDGVGSGAWPASIECQLAQGCVGDFIIIRPKEPDPKASPIELVAEVEPSPDKKRQRWKAGGERRLFPPARGQIWWSKHDWTFAELRDTRGRDDVESPVGEWTTVECTCDEGTIQVRVNGHLVNEVREVKPASGRIMLQVEGFELFFRKVELHPLAASPSR